MNEKIDNVQIILVEDGKTFTPFYFYTEFLEKVVTFYKDKKTSDTILSYKLTDDADPIMGRYRVDPIALPLLLSLTQQLKHNQNSPIALELSNFPATSKLLEFLYRSDFFYVAGKNTNPTFPIGKKLLSFDENHIGGFRNGNIRQEHKIRSYSITDDSYLRDILATEWTDDKKRDYFIEYYSYKVFEHFDTLLQESTNEFSSLYVDVLSELITNGIMHSGSDVFALMFSDKYSIKFSISDNGIGLYQSLQNKLNFDFELSNELFSDTTLNLSRNPRTESLVTIFEALYFSMSKKRLGLFDLMINVINHFSGYFRLHNGCSQIIFSSRQSKELEKLEKTRKEIRRLFYANDSNLCDEAGILTKVESLKLIGKKQFVELFKNSMKNYSNDIKFSAIRFYNVRFNGVHIEVEIPKQ